MLKNQHKSVVNSSPGSSLYFDQRPHAPQNVLEPGPELHPELRVQKYKFFGT